MVSGGVRLKDSGRYLDCARGLVEMSSKPWDVWWNLLEPVTFVKVFFLGLGAFPMKNGSKSLLGWSKPAIGENDSEPWDANRPGICPGFLGYQF